MLDKIKTPTELASYVGMPTGKLETLDPGTYYASFKKRKPGSKEMRLIEYPTGELARVLSRLCDGLQWNYLTHLTDAAYGFIRKVKPCNDCRDIYTNAKRHLGRKYLLNIDLDDFFHQIDEHKVSQIFSDYTLFSFRADTEALLTKLVTYHGRLPMGSPTSPPLSNFATICMDKDLLNWARSSNFVYTRFVDDLSFSTNMAISQTHISQIEEIIASHAFRPDPDKKKLFGPADQKEVTGLVLGKSISVPDEFITEFSDEILRFTQMYVTARAYPDAEVFAWIDKMKQVLNGRLAFLNMVYGRTNPVYRGFREKIDQMYNVSHFEESVSWRYAGYDYC